jgi:hypothetical protein
MTRSWTGPLALLLLSLSPGTWADAAAQSAPTDPPAARSARPVGPAPVVDVSQLPINIQRIERKLRQNSIREERDGLNLRYIIDVYGQAPRLEFFTKQDNLFYGPVPYGAPTHRDMIDIVTPQEFRAPAADFGNLFRWLADKSRDKSDKSNRR